MCTVYRDFLFTFAFSTGEEERSENKLILLSFKSLYSHRRIYLGWDLQRLCSPGSWSEQVQLQQVAQGHIQASSEHFWGQRCQISSGYLCQCHPSSWWEKLSMLRVVPVASCPVTTHSKKSLALTFSGPSYLRIIAI